MQHFILPQTVLQDHQLTAVPSAAPAPAATSGPSSTASTPSTAATTASDATDEEIGSPSEPDVDGVATDPSPPDPSDVDEGRAPDTAPAPDSSSSKSPSVWAIVAVVLAAVVLCSLAVGCFLFFRKRRASAAEGGGGAHAKEVPLTHAAACTSLYVSLGNRSTAIRCRTYYV